tara:strand:- start:220 stop:609 length:390 start_codon:yes stop_codon:yes gene_type:complete
MRGKTMAKVHHTKYKPRYEEFILDQIDEDYDGNQLTDRNDKIKFIFDCFNKEYGHEIARKGSKQKALADWLSGLPSSVSLPCYNGEVVDLAIEMGSIDPDPSDEIISRVLENYWSFMANILLDMERKSA